jgi:hypothetical protein
MTKPNERAELERWLEDNDQYQFILGYDDAPLRNLRRAKEATEAMDAILEEAAEKILALGRKYRAVGIGDTDTDEAIVAHLYRMIH